MKKACQCGKERTDGEPIYCKVCETFTHPVYVKPDAVRSGRELLTKF